MAAAAAQEDATVRKHRSTKSFQDPISLAFYEYNAETQETNWMASLTIDNTHTPGLQIALNAGEEAIAFTVPHGLNVGDVLLINPQGEIVERNGVDYQPTDELPISPVQSTAHEFVPLLKVKDTIKPSHRKTQSFQDPESGHMYEYNASTEESSWMSSLVIDETHKPGSTMKITIPMDETSIVFTVPKFGIQAGDTLLINNKAKIVELNGTDYVALKKPPPPTYARSPTTVIDSGEGDRSSSSSGTKVGDVHMEELETKCCETKCCGYRCLCLRA